MSLGFKRLRPIPVNPKLILICSPSSRSYPRLVPEGRNVTKVRIVLCCNSVLYVRKRRLFGRIKNCSKVSMIRKVTASH